MRRKRFTARRFAALMLLLACLFTGCASPESADAPHAEVAAQRPLPEAEGLRIVVASDLHLDPESRPGEKPISTQFSLELVDALLWDAERQGAELLLLTGDLVNGGKAYHHEALCEKLARAEAAGLEVCVVPGNHDLAPVTQSEFAALYGEFGYAEAYSRDESSLSYCVRRGALMLLMLDEGGYPAAACDLPGSPGAGKRTAFLSEATLRWVSSMLDEAEAQGLRVLCAGHYNLLGDFAQDPANEGYYIEGGAALAKLLREHGALLYCSGHIHTRAVSREDGLRELVTEFLLGYPTACGVLDLSERQLRYTPYRIDVDGWAAQSGQTEPILLSYARWQQDALRESCDAAVAGMAQGKALSEGEQSEAAAFFYAALDAYWQGTLSARREALEAMPGCALFFRCAEGYAYGWWLRELLENASPELAGFTVLF